LLELRKSGGLSTDRGVICSGGAGSSGYQAVNLALLLGATTILLVGYDMHHRKGLHWFGAHSKEVNRNQSDPQVFAKTYDSIDPRAYGVEIINCTPGSAVTAFPFGSLDDY
jgi:NADPH:quinone reductase-like Zn-dependent oxidoreductase